MKYKGHRFEGVSKMSFLNDFLPSLDVSPSSSSPQKSLFVLKIYMSINDLV